MFIYISQSFAAAADATIKSFLIHFEAECKTLPSGFDGGLSALKRGETEWLGTYERAAVCVNATR